MSQSQNQAETVAKSTPSSQTTKVTSKRTSREKISDVWDHFMVDESGLKNFRVVSNYCDKDYAGGTRKHGTSTLRRHLLNQCQKYPYRLEDKKQKKFVLSENK